MSVAWTVKQMKSWYDKLSKDFNSITRRELAEELREGMTSAKVYPYSARGYISKWYVTFSEYYEDDEKSEENELLMDLLQANSDAISKNKDLAYEIVDAMREFFRNTPVPVHPNAKQIEKLRLFHEKQFDMQQQYEKEQFDMRQQYEKEQQQYEKKHVKKTRKLRTP